MGNKTGKTRYKTPGEATKTQKRLCFGLGSRVFAGRDIVVCMLCELAAASIDDLTQIVYSFSD